MRVRQPNKHLQKYLIRKNLVKKFGKQLRFFVENPQHPSLNLELLEPKHAGIYSFRVDRKYRAIFVFVTPKEIEVIDVNLHYE